MKFGFIGLGNMSSAVIGGMTHSDKFTEDSIYGHNRTNGKTERLQEQYGLIPCPGNEAVARVCDALILGVKPQMMDEVLDEIRAAASGKLIITMAAGKPLSYYEERMPNTPVVRVMPNICASVGAASSAICGGKYASDAQLELVRSVFMTTGQVYMVPERLFAGFSAISGCAVAFAALFIEALASAGVREGFSKSEAQEIAAQTALGAALLIQRGSSAAQVMDGVCSPGGTTIEGMHALKAYGFEAAIYAAAEAVTQKDEKLSKA